jgi:hypothetical protein
MAHPVDRALQLWASPPRDGAAGLRDFREAYADPVIINGTAMSVADLVERARATHASLADLHFELVDRIDAGERCAIAFRQSGRHVAALPVPGAAPATQRKVTGLGIDLFTIVDDRIARIWVVSDLLSALTAWRATADPSP